MVRNKSKDWKRVVFSLDINSINKLKEISDFEGLSQSAMVDFLINNWDAGINPNNRLKKLQSQKEELLKKSSTIDESINKTLSQITLFNDWNKTKKNQKEKAVKILERLILDNRIEEAQISARTWQNITGTPSMELLIEAKQNIEVRGI
jgi:hypothetical protein